VNEEAVRQDRERFRAAGATAHLRSNPDFRGIRASLIAA
jgi:hypothetical protein